MINLPEKLTLKNYLM